MLAVVGIEDEKRTALAQRLVRLVGGSEKALAVAPSGCSLGYMGRLTARSYRRCLRVNRTGIGFDGNEREPLSAPRHFKIESEETT